MRRASDMQKLLSATSMSMNTWQRMAAVSVGSRVAILSSPSMQALAMAS